MSERALSPAQAVLGETLRDLSTRPYGELQTLPTSEVIVLFSAEGPIPVMRWVEPREGGGLKIVLQRSTAGFCCGGSLSAMGRIAFPDGRVEELPDAELYEFSMV